MNHIHCWLFMLQMYKTFRSCAEVQPLTWCYCKSHEPRVAAVHESAHSWQSSFHQITSFNHLFEIHSILQSFSHHKRFSLYWKLHSRHHVTERLLLITKSMKKSISPARVWGNIDRMKDYLFEMIGVIAFLQMAMHRVWFMDNLPGYMFLEYWIWEVPSYKPQGIRGWGGVGGTMSSMWKFICCAIIAFSNDNIIQSCKQIS